MRKTLLWASVALSFFMTFVGLSSLIDGIVQWHAFIQDIVDTYTKFIRDPLHQLAIAVWPKDWPTLPKWLIDALIVWTSFATVSQLYIALESEYVRTAEDEGLGASRIIITDWRKRLALWAFGPLAVWYFSREFVAKMQLLVDLEHSWFGAPPERPAFIQDAQRIARQMNRAYFQLLAYAVIGFVTYLFMNWQLVQGCRAQKPEFKRIGICEWRLFAPRSPKTRKTSGAGAGTRRHTLESTVRTLPSCCASDICGDVSASRQSRGSRIRA